MGNEVPHRLLKGHIQGSLLRTRGIFRIHGSGMHIWDPFASFCGSRFSIPEIPIPLNSGIFLKKT